jgi:hypothetical protein
VDIWLMHKILRGMSMVMLQQSLQKRKNGFHRKMETNLRVGGKKWVAPLVERVPECLLEGKNHSVVVKPRISTIQKTRLDTNQ